MKAAISAFMIAGVLVALTPVAEAQRTGFIVGIAPPVTNPVIVVPGFQQPMTVPFNLQPGFVQPFITAPVQPFVTAPVQPFITPGFGFPPPRRPIHSQGIVPGGFILQPQGHFFAGPYSPPQTSPQVAPPMPQQLPTQMPPIGASRAFVTSQLGTPSVTVITREGETLYYNGGITVFIQNGQVARPR